MACQQRRKSGQRHNGEGLRDAVSRRRNRRFAGSYGPSACSDENNNGTRAGFTSTHSDDGNSDSNSDPNGRKSVFD